MLRSQRSRFASVGVCILFLGGLFVLGGSGLPPDLSAGPGIDIEDPDVAPEAHSGEFVETSGVVVSTDPVIIEIETDDGGTDLIELKNAPQVETGEIVTVSGTLTEDGTLSVQRDRTVTRALWEITYMYLISIVGVLLVVATGIDSWRFDARTLSVEPRERPLHEMLLDRSRGTQDGRSVHTRPHWVHDRRRVVVALRVAPLSLCSGGDGGCNSAGSQPHRVTRAGGDDRSDAWKPVLVDAAASSRRHALDRLSRCVARRQTVPSCGFRVAFRRCSLTLPARFLVVQTVGRHRSAVVAVRHRGLPDRRLLFELGSLAGGRFDSRNDRDLSRRSKVDGCRSIGGKVSR